MSAPPPGPRTAGVVLAAGAGTRLGHPKGLLRAADGTPWVVAAAGTLRAAGLAPVVVVVGAQADVVAALVPADVLVVRAVRWADGPGASLAAGLAALTDAAAPVDATAGADAAARRDVPAPVDAALVVLVDAPTTPAVVRRVLAAAPPGPHALARATYAGRPGHPVLLGRDHWPVLADGRGARALLAGADAVGVPCEDLHDGRDADTAADLTGPGAVAWRTPGPPAGPTAVTGT